MNNETDSWYDLPLDWVEELLDDEYYLDRELKELRDMLDEMLKENEIRANEIKRLCSEKI